MITEDIENIRKNGFDVEEIPTGYIFTRYSEKSEGKQENILIHKETCEIIQKIGKITEIQVVNGEMVHIVVLRAVRVRLVNAAQSMGEKMANKK